MPSPTVGEIPIATSSLSPTRPIGSRAGGRAKRRGRDSFGSTARAQITAGSGFPDAYASFAQQTLAAMQQQQASGEVTTAHDVAQAVFRAATDLTVR